MESTDTALLGSSHLLAFQHEVAGLVVRAKVIEEQTGSAVELLLPERAALSSDGIKVYAEDFSCTQTGWHFVHYTAKSIAQETVGTSVSRFYVAEPEDDANETVTGNSLGANREQNTSSGQVTTEKSVTLPTTVSGIAGSISFKVENR